MPLISLTKNIIKLVDSTIYSFIWKGSDKIKRLALISDYKNGGLRMPRTQTMIDTQRIMCLKKYTEDYISPWKQILSFLVVDTRSVETTIGVGQNMQMCHSLRCKQIDRSTGTQLKSIQ